MLALRGQGSFHICGIVAVLPPSLPILNCRFLIFSASSTPAMTTIDVRKLFSPNIGRSRCFTRRWSCSILLFKYLLVRIHTRFGNSPFLLQIGYRAVGSSVSIECDLGGSALAFHRPTEKGFGGIHVPFSAQVEINGFHPLCLPGVGARAATHTAFRRDRPSHGRVDSAAIARSVSVGDRATLYAAGSQTDLWEGFC